MIYDWVLPGSKLLICDVDVQGTTEAQKGSLAFYKKVGQPVYNRPLSKLNKLLGGWKVQDPGFLSLEQWVGVKKDQVEQAKQRMGGGPICGAILRK